MNEFMYGIESSSVNPLKLPTGFKIEKGTDKRYKNGIVSYSKQLTDKELDKYDIVDMSDKQVEKVAKYIKNKMGRNVDRYLHDDDALYDFIKSVTSGLPASMRYNTNKRELLTKIIKGQRYKIAENVLKLTEKDVTKSELDYLEKAFDKLFAQVGIDIEFTRHFLDRVNDVRNGKPVTTKEIIAIYAEVYKKYGKDLAKLPDDSEAVLNDVATNLNIPFVIEYNNGKLDLIAKTLMRKKDFKSQNKKYKVQSENNMKLAESILEKLSKDKIKYLVDFIKEQTNFDVTPFVKLQHSKRDYITIDTHELPAEINRKLKQLEHAYGGKVFKTSDNGGLGTAFHLIKKDN